MVMFILNLGIMNKHPMLSHQLTNDFMLGDLCMLNFLQLPISESLAVDSLRLENALVVVSVILCMLGDLLDNLKMIFTEHNVIIIVRNKNNTQDIILSKERNSLRQSGNQ